MKKKILKLINVLSFYGLDFFRILSSIKNYSWFRKDYKEFIRQKGKNDDFLVKKFPILTEKSTSYSTTHGAYFWQDFYIARKIYENNPSKHVDIASRIDGFIGALSVFRKVEVIDVRTINENLKNVSFIKLDFTEPIPENYYEYTPSISSLHAIEHFGLGRYGDKIDYFGHLKAIENIYKMLKPCGIFYFSVPIGCQRVEFNAHRVFSLNYIFNIIKDNFEIIEFSYIDDNNIFYENIYLTKELINNNCYCTTGTGIFILRKI